MTRDELLIQLREMAHDGGKYSTRDCEADHSNADQLIVGYIDDPEIAAAFDAIWKWYA
jgi:hypothetical protein